MIELKETDFGFIASDWNFIPSLEFCSKITDGTHDSPKQQTEGKHLVTSKHIKGRNIDFDNAYLIAQKDFDNINLRSQVDQWDVIISMIGEYCGFSYVERNNNIDYAVKNVGLFKTGNEHKALWLYYFLNSKIGRFILEINKSGTSQPYLTLGFLRDLPIIYPPQFNEANKIIQILSSLDDKIDLLHRQNKTLEQLAETLFRQWFVEESEESWEIEKLGKIFEIGIGRTPPRKEQHWFTLNPNDVKWVSIKDMGTSGIYIDTVSEYLTQEAVKQYSVPIIPENTVMLSFKMTIGRLAISIEKMVSNEAIAHFKQKEGSSLFPEFLYLFLKTYSWVELGSTSSIVESINSQMIKEIEMLVPDEQKLNAFKDLIKPYFDKIRSNQTQIRTLTQTCDTLLPKLMSGEVRVEM